VSFSAVACPQCGSREPAGPYKMSAKEARRHRGEERNDRNLATISLALGGIGALYGLASGSSALGTIIAVIGYGLLGVMVGVPLAFAVNMTRASLSIARRPR
jgi:hypothetical protein